VKIVATSGNFHPDIGGPANYLRGLLPRLQGRGHSVSVVCFGNPGIDTHRGYPIRRVPRRGGAIRRAVCFGAASYRSIRGGGVVYVNTYPLPAMAAAWQQRKPYVVKYVTDPLWRRAIHQGWVPPDVDIHRFQYARGPLIMRIMRTVGRFYAKRAAAVIAPSRALATIIRGWGVHPDRIRVIPNAVDIESFSRLPDQREARRKLSLSGRVVLSLGRLAAVKRIDRLLLVMPELARMFPDINLVIAGEGPDRGYLEAAATRQGLQGRVRFTGRVDHRTAMLYLRAADILVVASDWETFPHTILEAWAAGTPVVATPVGGIPEMIRSGDSGILTPPEGIKRGLAEALESSSLSLHLVAGGRERVQGYAWGPVVKQTEAVLKGAINER